MGKGTLSNTVDITEDQKIAGTANERDINSDYSSAFYDFLTGKQGNQIGGALSAGAKEQADAAFSPFGVAMDDYAALQSNQARRDIEQRLAGAGIMGTGSGASKAAISKAIASPYAAANVQMQQNYGNMYQNAYGNLLGNLGQMSQQALVAPQYQDQKTGWGTALDVGTQLGGAFLGGRR